MSKFSSCIFAGEPAAALPAVEPVHAYGCGLFVPKPTRDVDCQGSGLPDLGSDVRRCPLASTAVGGDCYSVRYSLFGWERSRT
jgi:hypothetical protein